MPDSARPTPRRAAPVWRNALIVSFLIALLVTGCRSVGYYKQALSGQMQIATRKEPIAEVLKDPDTRPALREKLQMVIDIRDYAEKELNLKPDGHYLDYADLGRRFVVWNVYAAPEFSLEPKKWWYPVVGSLKYRGFFSEKAARTYAEQVAAQGYDVYVGGVDAYSTLGWFKDPVLNTFIHHEPSDLAELLFHELAHQRVFAAGDTDFNEAFATAVGEEGTRRWLAHRGDHAALAEYQKELDRKDQFVRLVMDAREKLKSVYGDEGEGTQRPTKLEGANTAQESIRARKQAVFDEMRKEYSALKQSWGGYAGYDLWFQRSLNNAKLNTIAAYYHLVPAFTYLLRENKGDLEGFYADAKFLAAMDKDGRKAEAEKLLSLARGENEAVLAQRDGARSGMPDKKPANSAN